MISIDDIVLIYGDCLEEMDKLIKKDIKVDAVITDEPYGTTQCKWDEAIPFDEMWKRLKLLRKDEHIPTILFGSEPFSSKLRLSNLKEYKYEWIWQKNKSTGFLNAKKQPLNDNELIHVFYKKQCLYNPQMTIAEKVYKRGRVKRKKSDCYGEEKNFVQKDNGIRYPKRIIYFNNNYTQNQVHPTQKPVDLMEYLIKTYTKESDLVLDFTMGSGTTGIACKNLNRRFIGIEKEQQYYDIAVKRLKI